MAVAEKITIPVFENQDSYRSRVKIDEIKKYEIDFSPWAEEHGSITSVEWILENGQAGISGETLTSNVASALLNFSEAGRSLVKVKASTATEVKTVWLDLFVYDPSVFYVNDYIYY